MAWTDKIFAYCERAGDPAFWAEPFNAISNVAFLIAALAGAVLLVRTPNARERRIEWGLVLLVTIIGIGSFLFHTYATRWASVADTAPIGIFMIGYLGFAMRRFLGASYVAVLVALGLFIAALRYAGSIPCDPELLPITVAAGRPCFNGSLGYVPALGALLLMGAVLIVRGHAAGWPVFMGGVVFRAVADAADGGLRGVQRHNVPGPIARDPRALAYAQCGVALSAAGGGDPAWRAGSAACGDLIASCAAAEHKDGFPADVVER